MADVNKVVLHETVSEIIELLGTADQLDLPNLTGVESGCRVLQFVEHEVQKKQDAKRAHDSSEYFLARPRRAGHALICPELAEWAASRASRQNAIAKEMRKAAEERAAAGKKS